MSKNDYNELMGMKEENTRRSRIKLGYNPIVEVCDENKIC